MYIYHDFFIHSSVDRNLGCFHVLAMVNSAAMNSVIHVSLSILVSSGYMPKSGIAGHMVVLFIAFYGISIPSAIVAKSSFKLAFSLSCFTLNKKLFNSLPATIGISSAYMKLLIFLREILIPDCDSSGPTLHMMYSSWKLKKTR